MLLARDVMNRRVVTLAPEMTVRQAADLLVLHRITGAPVVAPGGRLLGVVSQTDLVRRSRVPERERLPAFYQEEGRVVVAPAVEAADDVPVAQVMTPAVLEADEETPLADLARFMLRRRVHRVIIARDGRLRGIVTSMDMLRALARPARTRAASRRRRPVPG